MSIYFVDTSALAKRYLSEVGTDWILHWILPANRHVVVVSELATVEMNALLSRRQREGSIAPATTDALLTSFMIHIEQEYLVIDRSH